MKIKRGNNKINNQINKQFKKYVRDQNARQQEIISVAQYFKGNYEDKINTLSTTGKEVRKTKTYLKQAAIYIHPKKSN